LNSKQYESEPTNYLQHSDNKEKDATEVKAELEVRDPFEWGDGVKKKWAQPMKKETKEETRKGDWGSLVRGENPSRENNVREMKGENALKNIKKRTRT